jgi:uncharacterized protein (TIGR02996 family)
MARKRPAPPAEPARRWPSAQERAFLQAIIADPDDDLPRLVYADWLEENGDPDRAEFIRLQIERARRPRHDPARWRPGERERALEEAHRKEWLEQLPPMRYITVAFERGFPGWVYCEVEAFVDWDEAAWQAAPVTAVSLEGSYRRAGVYRDPEEWEGLLRRLVAMRELARLRGLAFSESDFRAQEVARLLASPHLRGLRSLTVNYHGIDHGDEIARVVARLRAPRYLSSLYLMGERIGMEGLRALLAWPLLKHVRVLGLGQNDFGDEGVELLAASRRLRGLEYLDLLQSEITDRGARALAASPHLAGLAYLDLLANDDISPAGRALLVERFGERVNFTNHG